MGPSLTAAARPANSRNRAATSGARDKVHKAIQAMHVSANKGCMSQYSRVTELDFDLLPHTFGSSSAKHTQ